MMMRLWRECVVVFGGRVGVLVDGPIEMMRLPAIKMWPERMISRVWFRVMIVASV